MRPLLLILSLAVFGLFGTVAYAQPLDDITTTVLEFEDSAASVQLTWNHDNDISNYEVGCVSCIPNFSENTIQDEIVLQNVTSLENGLAILYIIAYDDNDEVVSVKQVMLKLY